MKKIYLVIFTILFFFYSHAQYFTFPTNGNAVNFQLSPLTATDEVTLLASIRSTGCTPGPGSTFSYSTAHLSSGAIYRNTSWAAGCKNSTDIIKLDFSTVQRRPLGMKFSIFDVDNGSDSVSVEIYSAGVRVNYSYSLYTPTYVSANGSSPAFGFNGSGSNNSGQNDNTGRVDIMTVDPMIRIDSILVFKYNNRDISGNPSQSIAGFEWMNSTWLPIKLVSFLVNKNANVFYFNWKVSEETATANYQIEYSKNGNNFSETGERIPAKGIYSGEVDYSISFANLPDADALYFRLVSIDIDGKKYYSKIIKITNKGLVKSEVYPSSFTNSFSLAIHSESNCTGKLRLIGLDGRIVYQELIKLSKGQNLIPVDISSEIAKGMYIVVGEFGGELSFRHKLIKE